MVEKSKNKMQGNGKSKSSERSYFYPQYQKTVTASSQEEANKKVKALVDKKE